MKKTLLIMGAAVLALASCSTNADKKDDAKFQAYQQTYEGTLPAADCDGIRYTLEMNYTDSVAGTYEMTQDYMCADTTARAEKSAGDFTVSTGTPGDAAQKYIVLTPSAQDSTAAKTYFLVDNSNEITMTGSDLTRSDSPMNYTLKLRAGS